MIKDRDCMLLCYFFFKIHPQNALYDSDRLSVTLCWLLYSLLFVNIYGLLRTYFSIELDFFSNLIFKSLFILFSLIVIVFFSISRKWEEISDKMDQTFFKYRIVGFIIGIIVEISLFIFMTMYNADWIVQYVEYPILTEIAEYFSFLK